MPSVRTHGRSPSVAPRDRRLDPKVLGALVLIAAIPLGVFLVDPLQPLLEHHSFRQTQTALTSFWMLHGGGFFAYLTPVLGAPWTVPMEFPLFQAIVAFVVRVGGLPLDVTGRALALVFFYLTAIPIIAVLRVYGWPAVISALAIFVTSPIDLFFSRAFLIETFATLLSLSALAAWLAYRRGRRLSSLWIFVAFGILAGLQKITTFLPIVAVCGVDLAACEFQNLRKLELRRLDWRSAFALLAVLLPAVLWTAYSDAIKSGGALSALMTSTNLRSWNFGSIALRLRLEYWSKVFGGKILLLGGFAPVVVLLALAIRNKRVGWNRDAAMFAGAGLLGPLIFANLHFVHDYYLVGSLAFLACGAGILLGPYLADGPKNFRARQVGALTLLLAVNLTLFAIRYGPMLEEIPPIDAETYRIAQAIARSTAPDDVTIIVGLDWNGTIPYYSQRFALMFPEAMTNESRAAVLRDPAAYLDGRRVGAVVYCPPADPLHALSGPMQDALYGLVAGAAVDFGRCTVKIRAVPPRSGATALPRGPALPRAS